VKTSPEAVSVNCQQLQTGLAQAVTQHDFGGILKFVESTFSLPSLGYADATADDFSDCFDFNQTPLQFQAVPAALDAQYFVNDKTPPTDPDDD